MNLDQRSGFFDKFLDATVPVLQPVSEGDCRDIALKTSQFIFDSEDSLAAFAHITSYFPKYAHLLSRVSLNESYIDAAQLNQANFPPDKNTMWLNGLEIDVNPFNVFR